MKMQEARTVRVQVVTADPGEKRIASKTTARKTSYGRREKLLVH